MKTLRERVIDSLWVYHDCEFKQAPEGGNWQWFAYLRFVPVDMAPFRHGLSTGVRVEIDARGNPDPVKLQETKEHVADWLIEAWGYLQQDDDNLLGSEDV